MRAIFSDESRLQRWYDYEAALALAQADLGIIPEEAAREIASKAKISALIDPTSYVGLAASIVDRMLAETRASGWLWAP